MEIQYKLTRIVKGQPLPPPGGIYLRVQAGDLFRVTVVKTGYSEETYKLAAKQIAKDLVAAQNFADKTIKEIFAPPTFREKLAIVWRRFRLWLTRTFMPRLL